MPLSSSDVDALRATERALAESFEAAEPTAWVDYYTDDAIFVAPGSEALEGREALLAAARKMALSSVEIVARSTLGEGDLAATLGSASWVNGPRGSEAATSRVRFLIVWRREADGRWRIARELLNADPVAGQRTAGVEPALGPLRVPRSERAGSRLPPPQTTEEDA